MAEGLVQCYNKGCGQKFKEEENHDAVCTHHPGTPVFHDVLKGWSCCPKRCTDFTDFLNIPGCTTGRHNPVKPVEPKRVKEKPLAIGEEISVKSSPPPKPREPAPRPSDDLPYTKLRASVGSSLKSILARLKVQEEQDKAQDETDQGSKEPDNPEPEEVVVDTPCKNKGCTATFKGPESNYESCNYHPGFPIFHEGYKFWTCCQRRTTDFNEFLRQVGCKDGDHLWIENKKAVQCRYDWHQTGAFVVISVFAKACSPGNCFFEANPTNVRISLLFENEKNEQEMHINLSGVIDPEKSTVQLLGSKVEIKLRKADPVSWGSLQYIKPKPPSKD